MLERNWRHAGQNSDTSGLGPGPSRFSIGSVAVPRPAAAGQVPGVEQLVDDAALRDGEGGEGRGERRRLVGVRDGVPGLEDADLVLPRGARVSGREGEGGVRAGGREEAGERRRGGVVQLEPRRRRAPDAGAEVRGADDGDHVPGRRHAGIPHVPVSGEGS
eukprot:gene10744-biopygen1712